MMRTLRFASCYVYSPSGAGVASERSRVLRAWLKDSDTRFMVTYAGHVRDQAAVPPLAGFFDPANVLVPVPGSAPCSAGMIPVAERLARALLSVGLGCSLWPGLRRINAVQKSATAAPGCRPTVGRHYDSFAVQMPVAAPGRVMLIDDVVTKGRTLLAAASRLRDALPDTEIRAFALLRTRGMVAEVNRLLEPCIGEIRWRAGDAHRYP